MNMLNEDEVRAINIERICNTSDIFTQGVMSVFFFANKGMMDIVVSKVKEAYAPFQRVYPYEGTFPSADLIYQTIIGSDSEEYLNKLVDGFAKSLCTLCQYEISDDEITNATKFLSTVTSMVSAKLSTDGVMTLGWFLDTINNAYGKDNIKLF